MLRTSLAVVAMSTLATIPSTQSAHAADAEVCVLTVIVSQTAPRKPDIIETVLDCGAAPTDEQDRAIREVNNAMNAADAVEIMVRYGYEVEGSSWRDNVTGRQAFGVYTLVREGEAHEMMEMHEKMMGGPMKPKMGEAGTMGDEDLPEAGDHDEATEPKEDEAPSDDVEDFDDNPDDKGLKIDE